MTKDEKREQARVVVLWDASGIKVQANGANNPTAIAMLEMGKALLMKQTIGEPMSYGGGATSFARAPTLQPRQVDREVS